MESDLRFRKFFLGRQSMPINFFPCRHYKGQVVLRRRQQAGGIFSKNTGRIVGFVKIQLGNALVIGSGDVEVPATGISFTAVALIGEDHEKFLRAAVQYLQLVMLTVFFKLEAPF